MKIKTAAIISAVALFGALGIPSPADAAKGKASTKITIQGGGSVGGYVKSSNESKCANGRKIIVFRVKNGSSEKVGSDTAQANGNGYQWSVGNPGNGKYFAKAKETSKCEGDVSKTVKV